MANPLYEAIGSTMLSKGKAMEEDLRAQRIAERQKTIRDQDKKQSQDFRREMQEDDQAFRLDMKRSDDKSQEGRYTQETNDGLTIQTDTHTGKQQVLRDTSKRSSKDNRTSEQKNFDFAINRLNMNEEQARAFAFEDKTPQERAHDYARTMLRFQTDPDMGAVLPEDFSAEKAYRGYVDKFLTEYHGFEKEFEKSNEEKASDSISEVKPAPSAALDFLKQNPQLIEDFVKHYGYRPEGY